MTVSRNSFVLLHVSTKTFVVKSIMTKKIQVAKGRKVLQGRKSHYVYGIRTDSTKKFQTFRRYTEFVELKRRCERLMPGIKLPGLPGKEHWFPFCFRACEFDKDMVLEARRESFQDLLTNAVTYEELIPTLKSFMDCQDESIFNNVTFDQEKPKIETNASQTDTSHVDIVRNCEESGLPTECINDVDEIEETQIDKALDDVSLSQETEMIPKHVTVQKKSVGISIPSMDRSKRLLLVRILLFVAASCAYTLKPSKLFNAFQFFRNIATRRKIQM